MNNSGPVMPLKSPPVAWRVHRRSLVLYGDTPLISTATLELTAAHREKAAATLLSVEVAPAGYGRSSDKDNRVAAIVEESEGDGCGKVDYGSKYRYLLFPVSGSGRSNH